MRTARVIVLAITLGLPFALAHSASCEGGRATLDSNPDTNYLGGSYCRIDEGAHFPVRGIRNTAAYETQCDVPIFLREAAGGSGHCAPNNAVRSQNLKIKVESVDAKQGTFVARLGGTIGDVNMREFPHGSSVTYWLQGAKTIGNADLEFYLYLLDEPQASLDIYKRYRLEVFDPSCSGSPEVGVNFGPKSIKNFCTAPAVLERETASGDGYEPKK